MERQQRQACGTECMPLQSSCAAITRNATQPNTGGTIIIGWPGPLNCGVKNGLKTPAFLPWHTRFAVHPLTGHMSLMTHTQTAHTHTHTLPNAHPSSSSKQDDSTPSRRLAQPNNSVFLLPSRSQLRAASNLNAGRPLQSAGHKTN